MQRVTSRLFTGTHSGIVLGLVALLFWALLVYSNVSRNAQAAGTGFTQMQAYSSNFSTQNLSTDGITQVTLTKIPFTVPHQGKVEVTAIFSLVIYKPSNRVTSCVGCNTGTLNCSLMLDGSSISCLNDVYYSYNIVSQEYAMTTTSAVIAGTHTIALSCIGLLNPNYTSLVMRVKGRGMSTLVLF